LEGGGRKINSSSKILITTQIILGITLLIATLRVDLNIEGLKAEIIDEINLQRSLNGLNRLQRNSKLDSAAQKHSEDMASRNYLDHTTPEGLKPEDRVEKVNYTFRLLGEILQETAITDAEKIVQAWLQSRSHREIILNPYFTEIGIGIAVRNGILKITVIMAVPD